MDRRASLGGQRSRPPQRAVSGGPYGFTQPAPKRPTLPSGLSHIRSVSQPANVVDLTTDGWTTASSNVAAFVGNGETVVTSPDVINLEDEVEEPPAKRMKTSGADFRPDGIDGTANRIERESYVVAGTPLPSLPKATQSANRVVQQLNRRSFIHSNSRKAHGIDPPAIATRVPPPKKAADFSPWFGNHPEDVLNENVVKTGYMDKAQGANQAESNSAKAAISSSIGQKNSHGLSLLGYLFTAVLEKRQVLGKCTTPSAFKPPPRVTVTDTKREAWLRDLANPEVPLRKQSRTIPHGIRGKLLMEQCLSKDIPLQRAVWLAKCVGANELRAFRRKGISGSAAASGESKWVREWTVHVEQFLEDVIATCGQEGWRQKMNYSVRLATAFYSEKLLDVGHYLDWIVSSLANASLESLPIWLVLSQLYWKEIVVYGRRGRRLAEGILEHLHNITMAGSDSHAMMRLRLQKLLTVLAASNRGCLIIPRTWQKYKHLLTPSEIISSPIQTPAANIAKRNERLVRPLLKTAANTRSSILDVYDEFDSVGLDFDVDNLVSKSLQLLPDVPKLVSAVLEWASTHYRTGLSRIYVSARFIAHLHASGHDTDSSILHYLAEAGNLADPNIHRVHRVVVELSRLDGFSISRYFQWLLASGASADGGVSKVAVKLVTAFAETDIPVQLQNTRRTLMKRLGYQLDQSDHANGLLTGIHEAVAGVERGYPGPTELQESLSLSVKYFIGQQILANVSNTAKDFGIGLTAYIACRDTIERLQDIRSLTSLVTLATTTDNSALLATVADTINLHAESFAALGEFRRLVDATTDHYLLLRSQQPLDRTPILALMSLAQRVPEKAAFVRLLENDLVICDQQQSAVVCSPASDSLVGMHASNIESDEDIDAVFASGNTMDEQLMQRVFTRIMQRTLKSSVSELGSPNRICSWLNQLRSVEGSDTFESLVQNHVREILSGAARETGSIASTVYLIVSDCLTLGSVLNLSNQTSTPEVAIDALALFLSPSIAVGLGLGEDERYRLRLRQSRCREEHTEALMVLCRTACSASQPPSENSDLLSFLVWCISTKPDSAHLIVEDGNSSAPSQKAVGKILNAIITDDHSTRKAAHELDVRGVVSLAHPLSIRYCVMALQHLKMTKQFSESDEDALANEILDAFKLQSETWPQLLEFAGEVVNRKAHVWSQGILSRAVEQNIIDQSIPGDEIPRYVDLLAVTASSSSIVNGSGTMITITDKLKHISKALSENNALDGESRDKFAVLIAQLRLALDLCVMLVQGSTSENEAAKQAESDLLGALCTLLVHQDLQSQLDEVEYLFDLASCLSDKLPDTVLGLIQQQVIGRLPSDPRLHSILGSSSNSLDSWLVLASQVQPIGSQQQRALNKHVPQPQSSGRPTGSSQGQQGSQLQHQRMPSFGPSGLYRQDIRMPAEMKTTPFPLHSWEIMPEVMGENNTSLDLKLFGARKV